MSQSFVLRILKEFPHILVAVDYVTKWVEAIPTSSVEHNTSIKKLKEVIFPRFGVPRYLMIDGGSHFIHGAFCKIVGETDPRTPMGPADRAPFGSAGGGDRTKSRSRRSTRAVYPASELSGEITLLLLLVWLY